MASAASGLEEVKMNARYLRRMSLVLGIVMLAPVLQGCGVVDIILGGLARGLAALCEQPTLTVTKTVDTNDGACTSGDCSLREAIQTANACHRGQRIEVPNGKYVLTLAGSGEDEARLGDLDITDDLHLEAVGGKVIIDGAGIDRVFHVIGRDTTVLMAGITIRGGFADSGRLYHSPGDDGGGILNYGHLTLTDVVVEANHASNGAGILNFNSTLEMVGGALSRNDARGHGGGLQGVGGAATLVGTSISHNSARGNGGGVEHSGNLTLENVAVTGNVAYYGGGIIAHSGLFLTGSTIDDNRAEGAGGGLAFATSSDRGAVVQDTTVSNNLAEQRGGGMIIVPQSGGEVTLTNVTISGNKAGVQGGGIDSTVGPWRSYRLVGRLRGSIRISNTTITNNHPHGISAHWEDVYEEVTTTLENAILSGNGPSNCVSGANGLISEGHNLESDGSCFFSPAVGDIIGMDAGLGPLADNGGRTFTHALLDGSPAIDVADGAACPPTDQRGVVRPQGPGCDMGAYEAEWLVVPTPRGTPIGPPIPPSATPGGGTPTSAPPLLPTATRTPTPVAGTPKPTPTRTPTPVLTAPNAPSNLIVLSATCSATSYTVTLQWSDNAKNETGYRVYREGVLIATLPANSTGYTDSGPCCGPTKYAVEAYNSAGPSKPVEVTAEACVY